MRCRPSRRRHKQLQVRGALCWQQWLGQICTMRGGGLSVKCVACVVQLAAAGESLSKHMALDLMVRLMMRLQPALMLALSDFQHTLPLMQPLLCAGPAALEGVEDQLQLLPDMLLLDYLAASRGSRGGGSSSSSSTVATARRFMCCRMLHDTIHADRGAGVKDPKQLTLMLVQHRKLQDAQLPVLGESLKQD